ncbi:MAG TPA: WYL domain-containing protein [Pseudonocardia sp.]|jgi:predicted DNA-binding transcriptional regulator YafY|uniref:helix-turn-helix transcriptional regulator n=1 Tax=Pseudonocardia sp. TaxID=60912 RepID=UPI002ED9993E
MRASRLVSLLLLLQTRRRLTAAQLADALEVSVRTVYRDIESLGEAGVPVYGEPGHDGGYQLLDGYRTQLTGLTEGEAESLFLTGLPTAAADLGLGATVTAAQLKLMAALPAELRDRAGRVAERFHLDAPSWYREADSTPHLATAAAAVWRQRLLRMRYLRWAHPREVSRVVAPHGLVLKAGRWYLVARHPGDQGEELRTYRVSRLLDAELVDEPFERQPGFALPDYWRGYLARFDERRHWAEAELRVSADGFARLDQLLEPAVVAAARRTAGEPGADGWRRITVPIESPAQAVPELLRLGADAEVLAPAELRDHMLATLAATAAHYVSAAQRS